MNRVAKRYARALFELAVEREQLAEVNADLDTLRQLLDESNAFQALLMNPLISENQKLKAFSGILRGKLLPLTFDFLRLLTRKKRTSLLAEVLAELHLLNLAHSNQMEGELISAFKLEAGQVEAIQKNMEKMTGKTVLLKQSLAPELLGGFVVKVQDMVVDSSVRYQLQKLHERLAAR